tara:strand:- start:87 stop:371 length:285 start_codon:yes stop_codon:yes gene_type:complete
MTLIVTIFITKVVVDRGMMNLVSMKIIINGAVDHHILDHIQTSFMVDSQHAHAQMKYHKHHVNLFMVMTQTGRLEKNVMSPKPKVAYVLILKLV